MNLQKEKLEELSKRIRQVEADMKPKPKAKSNPVRDAGYDFAGTILGSVIFGVLLDRFFGTEPWCTIGMVGMGFVTGVLGMWRATKKNQGKE